MKEFMAYDFIIEKIVIACFVKKGTGNAIHQNRPSHGLAINLGGEKVYEFKNGEIFHVGIGDIIYLPKNSSYQVESLIHGDCYAINFDLSENISFEPFVLNLKNMSAVLESFRSAQKVWAQKKNGFIIKCKAELYNIIYSMQKEYFSEYLPKDKLNIISPALDYIHAEYTKGNINIEHLSDMCGITPEYFRRIFKSFFATSPVTYINSLKIARAKELLTSQMYSVSEAALASGYSDPSHFSREFKKATGVCPLEYIKEHN